MKRELPVVAGEARKVSQATEGSRKSLLSMKLMPLSIGVRTMRMASASVFLWRPEMCAADSKQRHPLADAS